MSDSQHRFVWFELMTTDVKAAEIFYADVIGWTVQDAGMPGMNYKLLSAGGNHVAGLMELPEMARASGGRPGWVGYIGVDDVAAAAAAVERAGGRVHRGETEIPGVGKFAIVADPHGAVFALFTGAAGQQIREPSPATPGHAGWHELHAGNGPTAFEFYSGLFGWTKLDAMDMGPAGVYQLFAAGGHPTGGIMTKVAAEPVPYWLFYFTVPQIDAAAASVEAGGGKILNGPQEVPGGSWIVQCLDPQGAAFAITAATR